MKGSFVFKKNIGFIIAVMGLSALLYIMISDIFPQQHASATDATTDNNTEMATSTIKQEVSTETASEQALVPNNAIAPDLVKSGKEFMLYDGLKDVFDSLILSANSTDKNSILALATSWCQDQQLNDTGCAEFEALFAKYIDYKIALASHENIQSHPQNAYAQIVERLTALQDLRYRWFSEKEIAALFSADHELNQQALQRRQIAMSGDLSREEKLDLIAQQLQLLPESQKVPLLPTLAMHELEYIKSQHEEKHLRLLEVETKFGYEAAQRLEKTWQKQADFQNKLEQIAEQYTTLEPQENSSLKKQQLLFLEQYFSGNEVRRAKAILKTYGSSNNGSSNNGSVSNG